jgi:polyphenol oxidase
MSPQSQLDWDAPGPYRVVFSTRVGGVSEPPFATLNLGKKLGDDLDRVEENRRRLCEHAGAPLDRLAMNYQVHSPRVNRAEAGAKGTPGDALWTDERELPVLALTADCVPVALVRRSGKPAVCVVHAGRIGILDGVLAEAARALGDDLAAAIGPAIGPCCYEVGDEVANPYRARFGNAIAGAGRLDLWQAADVALRQAGVEHVHRFDLCTACNADLFFSYRRDGSPRGGQGVLALVS